MIGPVEGGRGRGREGGVTTYDIRPGSGGRKSFAMRMLNILIDNL